MAAMSVSICVLQYISDSSERLLISATASDTCGDTHDSGNDYISDDYISNDYISDDCIRDGWIRWAAEARAHPRQGEKVCLENLLLIYT